MKPTTTAEATAAEPIAFNRKIAMNSSDHDREAA
jgi:hypothetical protein